MKKTPPIGTTGLYVLRSPWIASAAKTYTCHAIRSFKDLYDADINIYNSYYAPMGLNESAYESDRDNNANIITLMADEETIYVPDTYIDSYPDMSIVPYQHVVLSIDMGMLPDYVDLTLCKGALANTCVNYIGITPTIEEHIAPTTGIVTPDEHNLLEASRTANSIYTDTDRAVRLRLENQVEILRQQVSTLEQYIIEKEESGSL